METKVFYNFIDSPIKIEVEGETSSGCVITPLGLMEVRHIFPLNMFNLLVKEHEILARKRTELNNFFIKMVNDLCQLRNSITE